MRDRYQLGFMAGGVFSLLRRGGHRAGCPAVAARAAGPIAGMQRKRWRCVCAFSSLRCCTCDTPRPYCAAIRRRAACSRRVTLLALSCPRRFSKPGRRMKEEWLIRGRWISVISKGSGELLNESVQRAANRVRSNFTSRKMLSACWLPRFVLPGELWPNVVAERCLSAGPDSQPGNSRLALRPGDGVYPRKPAPRASDATADEEADTADNSSSGSSEQASL